MESVPPLVTGERKIGAGVQGTATNQRDWHTEAALPAVILFCDGLTGMVTKRSSVTDLVVLLVWILLSSRLSGEV